MSLEKLIQCWRCHLPSSLPVSRGLPAETLKFSGNVDFRAFNALSADLYGNAGSGMLWKFENSASNRRFFVRLLTAHIF